MPAQIEAVIDKSLSLLADAYVSPLFLNTVTREGIPAFAKSKRLRDEFERYCRGLKLLDKEDALNVISQPDSRILINSENLLPCIIDHSTNRARIKGIKTLNDRLRFRQLLSKAFPDYFFTEVKADKLKETDLPSGKDYVIKPATGFSGIGAKRLKGSMDLKEKAEDLISEVRKSAGSFNPDILNANRFLVEEYIKGEEIACDAFFDSKGEPIILGIYAHPLLNDDDFRDIAYYTSANLSKKMLPRIRDFLRKLSSQTGIGNFLLHAKFRLQRNRLMPIEMSPMMLGSFSLPDLTFFAFRLNPYRYYYYDQKPDWNRTLSGAGDEIFFRVLSRLTSKPAEGLKPDHEKFAATFENPIGYYKLDISRYPAFSIAFGRAKNIDEVLKYLSIDFWEYLS